MQDAKVKMQTLRIVWLTQCLHFACRILNSGCPSHSPPVGGCFPGSHRRELENRRSSKTTLTASREQDDNASRHAGFSSVRASLVYVFGSIRTTWPASCAQN